VGDHPVYVTAATVQGGEPKHVVVRICVDEDADRSSTLVELSLGLSWSMGKAADRPPAWQELTRRADVALAENGWTRTAEWSHHVWPQPLAQARVSRSG
jgi:hypothetical protein